MELSVDPCSLDRAASMLNEGIKLGRNDIFSLSRVVGNNFTEEPGLRNLGEQHGRVISGEVGSALQTLRELRRLIRWLAEGTKEMRGAFVGQDDASAAILCGLKSIQDTEFTFPTRPDGAFSPLTFRSQYQGTVMILLQSSRCSTQVTIVGFMPLPSTGTTCPVL